MIPRDLGFKMPPEWTRHARTLMGWPVKEAIWPEPFEEILPAYADIVRTVAEFEPVTLIVNPHLAKQAREFCGAEVNLIEMEHNDSWLRDSGPTMVMNQDGEVAGINWIFNAWGGKFDSSYDNLVAPLVLKRFGIPRFDATVVMEGGSIHVDGEGTLLTTEECLLNKNRNSGLSKGEIEDILKQYLNVEKVIWLKRGLDGDDTDGHVDNIASFARPGVIVIQTCSDPDDPNYGITRENLEILKNTTDARGRTFEIVEIEQPRPVFYDGVKLTLSYINFYFVNDGIILPVFGGESVENDRQAERTLSRLFPGRKIRTVNGMVIARGGGNVHCLTQQMPAGAPAKL